ncbi:transcriptional regulator [Lactiplantibacillus plantarum]|uniref:transcriptional regulator n=1 Tax=Lactiplantibacillus plantarum TaxID=1590 RepID=UPI00325D76DB
MERTTKKMVEKYLREYPLIDGLIAREELNIMYPYQEPDENVGGGRAQYKKSAPTEYAAISVADSETIRAFQHRRDVIDECLDECGEDTETLICELYFRKHQRYSVESLVTNGMIFVSKSKAYYLVDKFIAKVASRLNLYDVSDFG